MPPSLRRRNRRPTPDVRQDFSDDENDEIEADELLEDDDLPEDGAEEEQEVEEEEELEEEEDAGTCFRCMPFFFFSFCFLSFYSVVTLSMTSCVSNNCHSPSISTSRRYFTSGSLTAPFLSPLSHRILPTASQPSTSITRNLN
ncbi:uncharacterized protein EI97DRAFT_314806 [Westerdykella ornata]|uniref:Uncharacterized protein n=1 Tax=Westerdykella ornata TaxID=318751 RepID=A0A6A6JL87_WESOR|nr:uncharacterized protein EI97DRAFT_314806 [Westerdykella ornata]KAF2277267.1 hypothetical protein EI97DRAFT_314806 [Westerdykella ornata]